MFVNSLRDVKICLLSNMICKLAFSSLQKLVYFFFIIEFLKEHIKIYYFMNNHIKQLKKSQSYLNNPQ